MIQLTYQELYRINPLEARKILLKTFEETGGNVLRTAKTLRCSQNTVKKFVRRQQMGLSLANLSRRPRHSPRQTAKEIEELVVKERKLTNFGRLRLAYHIREKHGPQLSSFPTGDPVRTPSAISSDVMSSPNLGRGEANSAPSPTTTGIRSIPCSTSR